MKKTQRKSQPQKRFKIGKIFSLIYINFNFDFLAFEVYFENNFANQLRKPFVLKAH